MDPLTVFFAYFTTWVNTLHYTLGVTVIALAFVYFARTLPRAQRIAIPMIVGVVVSVIGTGVLIPASELPQLGYPPLSVPTRQRLCSGVPRDHCTDKTQPWLGTHRCLFSSCRIRGDDCDRFCPPDRRVHPRVLPRLNIVWCSTVLRCHMVRSALESAVGVWGSEGTRCLSQTHPAEKECLSFRRSIANFN